MKFQYSVIGDNTKENRDHAEKIGYRFRFGVTCTRKDPLFIITKQITIGDRTFNIADLKYTIEDVSDSAINCIGNPQLFQAVTAMREDSDYMQWFADGSIFIHCDRDEWLDMYSVLCQTGAFTPDVLDTFHKVTLSKLQEHFKTEKK